MQLWPLLRQRLPDAPALRDLDVRQVGDDLRRGPAFAAPRRVRLLEGARDHLRHLRHAGEEVGRDLDVGVADRAVRGRRLELHELPV